MADKPASPFSSLGSMDKALLRSTSQRPSEESPVVAEPGPSIPPPAGPQPRRNQKPSLQTTPTPRKKSTQQQVSKPSIDQASVLDSYPEDLIDRVRKTVKVPGREVSFIRLSADEKASVADIVYTYKRKGQRTSETDISRIALNLILEDYEQRGEHSFLASVLDALRA